MTLLSVAAPVLATLALTLGPDPVEQEAHARWIHREGGYVGATACQGCHPDHHASWRRTHHSTMTQLPTPATVRGEFDGQVVAFGGKEARPLRNGATFCIEITGRDGARRAATVAMAVGSRRYQQYFEREARKDGEALVRLPILWHIAARRWLPLSAVFLEDDLAADEHRATWNDNCILCHNTGPMPRMVNYSDPAREREGPRFDSEVAELGISCESCHGPGAEHVRGRTNPLARYAQHFAARADATIENPARLDQERAVSACGQCHGARLPEPLARWSQWMTSGPTFRSGDRLQEHVAPITASTPVRGNADPELFKLRFWEDGTPRLTAYELQGVTASACYLRGKMTCQSCHSMHAGDPKGQLRPDRPGNAMCMQCHEAIARDVPAHTHHAPGSAGSSCVECHMPRIVYGILEIHRSHRIESPDPARDAEKGRPHACTLCHADRTPAWSAAQLRRLWGKPYADPVWRRDKAPLALPDAIASLFAGDAVARAVYATAAGRDVLAVAPGADGELRAALAVTLGDGYPSVRWLARRSLLALESRAPIGLGARLEGIDTTSGPGQRARDVNELLGSFARCAPGRFAAREPGSWLRPDWRIDARAVVSLTDLQGRSPIQIGE